MEDKKIVLQQRNNHGGTFYRVLKTVNITRPKIDEILREKEVKVLIKLEINIEIIGT